MASSGDVLVAEGTTKSFFGNVVLDGFHLRLQPGEVHALLGHNGSGKSTFIKVLSGYHEPDAGSGPIRVGDDVVDPGDPTSSHDAGLRFVHQDLGLIPTLSVLENLRLGTANYRTSRVGRIRWRSERSQARHAFEDLGLELDPEARLGDLSPVEQAMVAITRAVDDADSGRVLVLDEPTARLPESEVDRLFGLVRRVSERGMAVLYVTHRMEEIHAICDSVSVLRSGVIVGRGSTQELSRQDLVDIIVGDRAVTDVAATGTRAEARPETTPVIELEGVAAAGVRALDLQVAPGEVVGVAGLVGSGVDEVPRVLMGESALLAGTVRLDGDPLSSLAPAHARRRGLVVLPSRRQEKLIQEMTVRENLTITMLERYWTGLRFDHGAEREHARQLVEEFDIACDSTESLMRTLSGGNQQKVAVTRSLQLDPRAFVLDEPTQGIDVHGKGEIVALLRQAAGRGVGVLVCSSDLEELEVVCDRIVVLRDGAVAAELRGEEITRQAVLAECYGSTARVGSGS